MSHQTETSLTAKTAIQLADQVESQAETLTNDLGWKAEHAYFGALDNVVDDFLWDSDVAIRQDVYGAIEVILYLHGTAFRCPSRTPT